jgi:hypothetical protein
MLAATARITAAGANHSHGHGGSASVLVGTPDAGYFAVKIPNTDCEVELSGRRVGERRPHFKVPGSLLPDHFKRNGTPASIAEGTTARTLTDRCDRQYFSGIGAHNL